MSVLFWLLLENVIAGFIEFFNVFFWHSKHGWSFQSIFILVQFRLCIDNTSDYRGFLTTSFLLTDWFGRFWMIWKRLCRCCVSYDFTYTASEWDRIRKKKKINIKKWAQSCNLRLRAMATADMLLCFILYMHIPQCHDCIFL